MNNMEIKILITVLTILNINVCECDLISYTKQATVDDVGGCDSLNFTQRTEKYGYTSEEYSVTTTDGYKLELFRIRYSEKCTADVRNVPVLLLHGVISNGMSWIAIGPDSSVAYALSDACYDVWLVNFRGTSYSREHVTMTPATPAYWEFSMDEYAKYDLPAFIDKVIETSGSEKLNIIGYSEGGAVYLAFASTNKEYRDKVGVGITLEPSAYMYAKNNVLKKTFGEEYRGLHTSMLGMSKLANNNHNLPDNVLALRCENELKDGTLCTFIYQHLFKNILSDVSHCLFGSFPEPITLYSLQRYAQHIKKRIFQMLDFGPKNVQKYGASSPPEYNVTEITTPVSIVYTQQRFIVTKDNLLYLKDRLNNVISFRRVDDPAWGHLSFIFANNINEELVPIVQDILDKYSD